MYYIQNQFTDLPIYQNLFLHLRMRAKTRKFILHNIESYQFDKYLNISVEIPRDYYMLGEIMNVISTASAHGFVICIILVNKKRDCASIKNYINNDLYEIYLNDTSATSRYSFNNLVKPSIIILEKKEAVIQNWITFLTKFNERGNNLVFLIDIMSQNYSHKKTYQVNFTDFISISPFGIILTVTSPHTSTHHTPPR